jgi:hypothetical protein
MNEDQKDDSLLNEVHVMTREDRKHIGNAKIALYVVCGLHVLGAIIATFRGTADQVVDIWIEAVIVAGAFLVLSMLAEKWTFQALLIGLIVYILYQGLYIVIDPSNIYKGIIVKIAIIIYLSRGLIYAYDVEKAKKAFKK